MVWCYKGQTIFLSVMGLIIRNRMDIKALENLI
jgi:hypothetical protein